MVRLGIFYPELGKAYFLALGMRQILVFKSRGSSNCLLKMLYLFGYMTGFSPLKNEYK